MESTYCGNELSPTKRMCFISIFRWIRRRLPESVEEMGTARAEVDQLLFSLSLARNASTKAVHSASSVGLRKLLPARVYQ